MNISQLRNSVVFGVKSVKKVVSFELSDFSFQISVFRFQKGYKGTEGQKRQSYFEFTHG